MKKYLKTFTGLILLGFFLFFPYLTFATSASGTPALDKLQTIAGPGYNTSVKLPIVMGTIIRTALSLLGIIFIIILIVAGFRWMVASGNEEKVTKAQNSLKRGIIGLVIVIGAWAIWTFLLQRLIAGQ